MCGIYFALGNTSLNGNLTRLLMNRGPDKQLIIAYGNLVFGGFVLWQQGNRITTQPIETENFIILFNGDLFNIENLKHSSESDVSWLADRLSSCATELDICVVLKSIQGPFSIIFFDKRSNALYFARDSLGRNSLLLEKDTTSLRILSTSLINRTSVKTAEVPSLGLFRLNIRNPDRVVFFPWTASLFLDYEPFIGITYKIERSEICINPQWLCAPTFQKQIFDLYELCSSSQQSPVKLFQNLLQNTKVLDEINKFSSLLAKSVQNRVENTRPHCSRCIFEQKRCRHSKIAILFSGGIDCSILAVLVNNFADSEDSIDLINIACKGSPSDNWNVPDRISAKLSLEDLKKICPLRKWNFIEVNTTHEECQKLMASHIKHLIYPLNTILDESLGTAFWLAARGEGTIENESHKSSARVVIIGSGADELFGGYKRHKNAYMNCLGSNEEKILAVERELQKDWHRIASRNLGRDDRVVADSGKTLRAPFIEEEIVQYVRGLKANQLSCYMLEDGIGDKLFLRLYGFTLGLKSSPFFKKRAIQFGSKLANKKQNARDISKYLLQTPMTE